MLGTMKGFVRRRAISGFTLIELMTVVAVVGILLLVALPTLQDMIRVQRLKGINAEIVTDLQYARTEATSRGVLVNVRFMLPASGYPLSCYILFTDIASSTVPSTRCSCRLAAGARCPEDGTAEIRTVVVPTSLGVALSIPTTYQDHFAFDPVTGGILLPATDFIQPVDRGIAVLAAIDSARTLRTDLARSGRPSVCAPTGSTMPEPAC
jgi:prepilin-type N-terminal cleavage/methylation domain-containing protein